MCSACRSYRPHPVKMYISHRARSHSDIHLSNVTDHTDPAGLLNPPVNLDHANLPMNFYADHADGTDPISVKRNISYRSHRFHSGRSYRSCRSHICTDRTDQVPTQVHMCEIFTSDLIPAKHDVNLWEVSRFYRSFR